MYGVPARNVSVLKMSSNMDKNLILWDMKLPEDYVKEHFGFEKIKIEMKNLFSIKSYSSLKIFFYHILLSYHCVRSWVHHTQCENTQIWTSQGPNHSEGNLIVQNKTRIELQRCDCVLRLKRNILHITSFKPCLNVDKTFRRWNNVVSTLKRCCVTLCVRCVSAELLSI